MSEITPDPASVRTFATGATRNTDTTKLDFEGFLHPLVLRRFAEYMHTHRVQADGTLRSADNWQKGIPADVYMKSLFRHFMDVWSLHRGVPVTSPETGLPVEIIEALMACLFNVQGLAFELLREEQAVASPAKPALVPDNDGVQCEHCGGGVYADGIADGICLQGCHDEVPAA